MFEAITYAFFAAFVADAIRSLKTRERSATPFTTEGTPPSVPNDPSTPT